MEKILIVVSSLAIGSLLGEWWNLEKGAEQVSDKLKRRFRIGNERFSEAWSLPSVVLCGLHDHSRYNPGRYRRFSRPALHQIVDGLLLSHPAGISFRIGSCMLGTSLFIFQAILTLLAGYAETSSAKRSYSDSPMWGSTSNRAGYQYSWHQATSHHKHAALAGCRRAAHLDLWIICNNGKRKNWDCGCWYL